METTPIPEIHGQVLGLRAGQLAMLERLYRRRMPVDEVLSAEAAKTLAQFSHEIRRPIGLVITRRELFKTSWSAPAPSPRQRLWPHFVQARDRCGAFG